MLFAFGFLAHVALGQSETELRQMIEKNNKIMADAMKADDVEKALALYDDDIIQLPAGDKIIRGKEGVRRDIEASRKAGWKVKEYTMNIEDIELHGDVVTEIGTYKMSVQKDGSADASKFEGKYLTQWEKQSDGSLKLKTEIWNYDNNNSSMATDANKDIWNDSPDDQED
jgi:ketosteroid isomerase-like protein